MVELNPRHNAMTWKEIEQDTGIDMYKIRYAAGRYDLTRAEAVFKIANGIKPEYMRDTNRPEEYRDKDKGFSTQLASQFHSIKLIGS